jgi:hypothetical protein
VVAESAHLKGPAAVQDNRILLVPDIDIVNVNFVQLNMDYYISISKILYLQ